MWGERFPRGFPIRTHQLGSPPTLKHLPQNCWWHGLHSHRYLPPTESLWTWVLNRSTPASVRWSCHVPSTSLYHWTLKLDWLPAAPGNLHGQLSLSSMWPILTHLLAGAKQSPEQVVKSEKTLNSSHPSLHYASSLSTASLASHTFTVSRPQD